MSRLLFRSVHGHKMNVADPDILTQSFSKSGYGAVRVTKTNPLCMLSALIREGGEIQVTSSRFSCIFYMAEFGYMVTPADSQESKYLALSVFKVGGALGRR